MPELLSKAQRTLGLVLVVMFLTALGWAVLGSLDIVVSAQGKLVPENFVNVSQPRESGAVSEILVKDGQKVAKGDLLLKLDDKEYAAQSKALQAEKGLLNARLGAVDKALGRQSEALPQVQVSEEFALRKLAYLQELQTARYAQVKTQADLRLAEEAQEKYVRLLGLAQSAEASAKQLYAQGFTPRLSYEEKLKETVSLEQELEASKAAVSAAAASALAATSSLQQINDRYRQQLSQEGNQTRSSLHRAEADLAAYTEKLAQTEIRAPVSGVVTNLAVKHIGQVVGAGAPLLSIVPQHDALVADVWVKNEDAGFFAPDRLAKIKLHPFPFQKYGWLEGTVLWVGADSETPDSMKNVQGEPLFYKARVRLAGQKLTRNNVDYALKAGMQVQVDVLLGERSLFEYLTSPLKRVALEAAREH